jgi:hypothetical protein
MCYPSQLFCLKQVSRYRLTICHIDETKQMRKTLLYLGCVWVCIYCKTGHRIHLFDNPLAEQINKLIRERPLFSKSSPKHPFGVALQINMANS